MWALIAFIGLGVVVAALIEVNERIKAKKPQKTCLQKEVKTEDCSACELISVCEKEGKDKGKA